MTMWTDRSAPSDDPQGPAPSPEERQAARQAQRAAQARRLRLRRLSVTVAVVVLALVGAILVFRPDGDPAPQAVGIASMATPAPPSSVEPAPTAATPSAAIQPSAGSASAEPSASTDTQSLPADDLPVATEGDYGTVIEAAQRALDVEPTGYFGPKTRKAVAEYQESIGLPATGKIGPFTWSALGAETVESALAAADTPDGFVNAPPADLQETPSPRKARSASSGEPPVLEETDSGESVAVVQRALGVKPATGYFGPKTAQAVKSFQSDNGIPTTGVIATYTWAALGPD
ncbi:MAG: peptidoglycan-binding domain-containing protein, partial [Actinomycetota bacterium]